MAGTFAPHVAVLTKVFQPIVDRGHSNPREPVQQFGCFESRGSSDFPKRFQQDLRKWHSASMAFRTLYALTHTGEYHTLT